MIKSVKNRKYLWPAAPILVLIIYVTRIWHGPKVAQYHDCDLSICSDLSVYADGSFYFKKCDQNETITKSGIVEIKNDTCFLRPGFHFSLNWNTIKNKAEVSTRPICPVGFSFTFPDEFNKK